nr:EOG090X0CQA [Triops cancriformis]
MTDTAQPEAASNGNAENTTASAEGTSELEQKIIRQVEYYFGDFNVSRDKFMKEQIGQNDGWIPMETMLKFKRLAQLSTDAKVIVDALKKSTSGLLEFNEDNSKLRRMKPVPENNEEWQKATQERTVYCKGFEKKDTTLDSLLDFFKAFSGVENVQESRKEAEKAIPEINLPKGTVLCAETVPEGVNHIHLRQAITDLKDVEVAFVTFEDKKAFIRLKEEGAAKKVMEKLGNEGLLTVPGQEEKVALKVLEGEEEEKYLVEAVKNMKEAMQNRNKGGRGGRGGRGGFRGRRGGRGGFKRGRNDGEGYDLFGEDLPLGGGMLEGLSDLGAGDSYNQGGGNSLGSGSAMNQSAQGNTAASYGVGAGGAGHGYATALDSQQSKMPSYANYGYSQPGQYSQSQGPSYPGPGPAPGPGPGPSGPYPPYQHQQGLPRLPHAQYGLYNTPDSRMYAMQHSEPQQPYHNPMAAWNSPMSSAYSGGPSAGQYLSHASYRPQAPSHLPYNTGPGPGMPPVRIGPGPGATAGPGTGPSPHPYGSQAMPMNGPPSVGPMAGIPKPGVNVGQTATGAGGGVVGAHPHPSYPGNATLSQQFSSGYGSGPNAAGPGAGRPSYGSSDGQSQGGPMMQQSHGPSSQQQTPKGQPQQYPYSMQVWLSRSKEFMKLSLLEAEL